MKSFLDFLIFDWADGEPNFLWSETKKVKSEDAEWEKADRTNGPEDKVKVKEKGPINGVGIST